MQVERSLSITGKAVDLIKSGSAKVKRRRIIQQVVSTSDGSEHHIIVSNRPTLKRQSTVTGIEDCSRLISDLDSSRLKRRSALFAVSRSADGKLEDNGNSTDHKLCSEDGTVANNEKRTPSFDVSAVDNIVKLRSGPDDNTQHCDAVSVTSVDASVSQTNNNSSASVANETSESATLSSRVYVATNHVDSAAILQTDDGQKKNSAEDDGQRSAADPLNRCNNKPMTDGIITVESDLNPVSTAFAGQRLTIGNQSDQSISNDDVIQHGSAAAKRLNYRRRPQAQLDELCVNEWRKCDGADGDWHRGSEPSSTTRRMCLTRQNAFDKWAAVRQAMSRSSFSTASILHSLPCPNLQLQPFAVYKNPPIIQSNGWNKSPLPRFQPVIPCRPDRLVMTESQPDVSSRERMTVIQDKTIERNRMHDVHPGTVLVQYECGRTQDEADQGSDTCKLQDTAVQTSLTYTSQHKTSSKDTVIDQSTQCNYNQLMTDAGRRIRKPQFPAPQHVPSQTTGKSASVSKSYQSGRIIKYDSQFL